MRTILFIYFSYFLATGEDLVPESTCQGEETARGRDREVKNGCCSSGTTAPPVRSWASPSRTTTVLPPSSRSHSPCRAGTPPNSRRPAWQTPHTISDPTTPNGIMSPSERRNGLTRGHGWFHRTCRFTFSNCHRTLVTSAQQIARHYIRTRRLVLHMFCEQINRQYRLFGCWSKRSYSVRGTVINWTRHNIKHISKDWYSWQIESF